MDIDRMLSKAICNPFRIVPLITQLLKILSDIPDEDIAYIYEKYPDLKQVVDRLKAILS